LIISHRYKYVFVEVPRTGSTAISAELCRNYDGHRILKKHSYYSTFLGQATENEKRYRVFSGLRNPLDDLVSRYRKICTKDEAYYAGSRRNIRRYRFVHKHNTTFSEYLHKFHRLPFDLWTSTYHDQFDLIIRFDELQAGFEQAIDLIGAELVRPLPAKNRTDRGRSFVSYYSEEDIAKAVWIFGPYMKTWEYEFPGEWGEQHIPASSWTLFKALRGVRRFYWNNLRDGDGFGAHAIRKLILD
jgi:hypothetical protein